MSAGEQHDEVERPAHYTGHPSGVECITITEHMSFTLGNAVKYLWRAGLKGGTPTITDLRKARWYVDREIARLEGVTCAATDGARTCRYPAGHGGDWHDDGGACWPTDVGTPPAPVVRVTECAPGDLPTDSCR